jgi:3-oxoacyl-[acyl-carrier-protein] synthase-3
MAPNAPSEVATPPAPSLYRPVIDRAVGILGTGRAQPRRKVTNAELRPLVKGYDEASGDFTLWVDRVTHIQSRNWIDPSVENAGTLALEAGTKALEQARVAPSEVDQLIFCSFTYNELFPGEHALMTKQLGMSCGTFLMTAACAGSVFGITLARSLVQSGQCRNVLVVASECISRVTNFDDPITAILFGDSAGAVLVGKKDPATEGGFLGQSVLRTEYNADSISMRNGNCPTPKDFVGGDVLIEHRPLLKMEGGPRVLRNAVNRMSDVVVEALGFTSQDLKDDNPELRALLDRAKIVPHQANGRIVDGLQEKLGCPRENMYRTIYITGNTSASSNVFTLDHAVREGNLDRTEPAEGSGTMGIVAPSGRPIRKGDLVVTVSIGAGYVFGAVAFIHGY